MTLFGREIISLNRVEFFNHFDKHRKAYGHTLRVLNLEGLQVVTRMVAPIKEKGCLTAVFLNRIHQQGAVFATGAVFDIKDAIDSLGIFRRFLNAVA